MSYRAHFTDFMILRLPRCGYVKNITCLVGLVLLVLTGTYVLYFLHSSYNAYPLPVAITETHYQYGIMIDAGSSGSRVYLYRWPPSQRTDELLHIEQMKDKSNKILVMKTSPGLSAYADNPSGAYRSLKPLLLYAAMNIPMKKHSETPLYILCTAGMRMLSEEKRNNILNLLYTDIQQNFNFFFQSSHIEVIDGRLEGVYGWIAVNYMLGRFNHDANQDRTTTVGALDMGGASTQITYEVPKNELLPPELTMDIDLGCHAHPGEKSHTYHLYSTTFLEFGANEARKRYVELMVKKNDISDKTQGIHVIADPCLPVGMQETETTHLLYHVVFRGTGNFTQCRQNIFPLLNIPTTCPRSPCSMNGVFQPPINYYQQEMYGFSEYWYTMDDILKIGGSYREEKFIAAAKQFCATDWNTLSDRFKSGEFPNADQHRFHYQCFKSAWVLAVLHDGHRFPSNYDKFISAKTVNREIVQWTYGAMIYRTRYLPLQTNGVNKELSITKSHLDSLIYHGLILCFLVVMLAIGFWCYKLRKIRYRNVLPQNLKDLDPSLGSINTSNGSTIYHNLHPGSKINFNNVCQAPTLRTTLDDPILPRSFSDNLLNRDIGSSRSPLILG